MNTPINSANEAAVHADATAATSAPRGRLTETGRLPIGIVIDGIRHQDFELRPATIGDNIEAVEMTRTNNGLEISCALFALQLLKLGSLSREQITLDLIVELNPVDYGVLETAVNELQKKVMRDGQSGSVGGTPVAQPLPATA